MRYAVNKGEKASRYRPGSDLTDVRHPVLADADSTNSTNAAASSVTSFLFYLNREREGEAQTVQKYGKRSRQSARLT
jgi:hypothetical protein